MKTFPMFLRVANRRVLILGGGEQAAQKCRLFLKTEAHITVQAPEIEQELRELVARGRITHDPGAPTATACADTAITFIGTGCPGNDAALHALAKAGGALVNVVDQPSLCDAITPSIVDRDPVVVAIGTEGTAPVLGRQIKTRIEELLEPNLGALAAFAGDMRDAVAFRLPRRARRPFWRWVFHDAPRRAHAAGDTDRARAMIHAAVDAGHVPQSQSGKLVSFVPSDGDRDHLTLAAVQRLQEADLILYDPELAHLLELARRDADRAPLSNATFAEDTDRIVVLHKTDGQPALPLPSDATVEHLACVR